MTRSGWLLLGLLVPAAPASGVDFSGSYTLQAGAEVLMLSLTPLEDGTLSGTLSTAGGSCTVRGEIVEDEEEVVVEGEVLCAAGGGELELSWDEEADLYHLFLVPRDAAGTLRPELATLYQGTRRVPVEGGAPGADRADRVGGVDDAEGVDDIDAATAGAGASAALVGVWATQIMVSTSGGSLATQLLMEFRSDGTLVDLGSRAIGGGSGVSGDTGLVPGGEVVAWRTEGGTLLVSPDGVQWVALALFELADSRLLLSYTDGSRQLWYRQTP